MSFDPSTPPVKSARNRYRAALLDSPNLIGLAGFLAVSIGYLSLMPLLAAAVVEAAYILFVPDSKWFTKRMSRQFDLDVVAHREEIKSKVFPKVRPDVISKFNWLEQARTQIEASTPTQDPWFRDAMRKLDFLMEKYLQFADREAGFIRYVKSLVDECFDSFTPQLAKRVPFQFVPFRGLPNQSPAVERPLDVTEKDVAGLIAVMQEYYDSEIQKLTANLEVETIQATRDILTKRIDVIKRRREFIIRLGDILVNIRQQMVLIAETFGLINDEIRARSPEQVLADIDDVVIQATSLTDAIDLVTPSDQIVAQELKA